MRIETLEPKHLPAYDTFVQQQQGSLLYHSSRYMGFLADLLGCNQASLIAVADDGQVTGALPLMSMDGPLGTVFNSLPYYGSNGGLLGRDGPAREALIEAYRGLARDASVAASTVIGNPMVEDSLAGLDHDLEDERIGQVSPIAHHARHDQALMASFHFKTRNMIRKAEKLGVQVAVDNARLGFLADVHEENMREIGGLAKSRDFFARLPAHFRAGRDYRVYVSHLNGEPVAALLVFHFNRTAEYYTPVVRKEFRETQALSAAIFAAMCDASREGMAWWNWGGTWLSQDGVHRFKSRWATRDIRYRYNTTVRNRMVLNASRAELLAGYPSFYVVPFSALITAEANHAVH